MFRFRRLWWLWRLWLVRIMGKIKPKGYVKDIDLGLQAIQTEINLLKKSYVLIGLQHGDITQASSRGDHKKEGGISLAQIAADNEFGTKKIPARPFMSTSFDENKSQINQAIQGQYSKILNGTAKTYQSLSLIGLYVKSLIQRKINAITFPPNSPKTIAAKGSSKPLIDFGQMLRGIREMVVIKK